MADRKFQEGTVGSTNVIEGMAIPVGYEQLVNYVELDFSSKQADWTETGGTFEYTEAGLHQTENGTKGTVTESSAYKAKVLSIPVNITKESFSMFVTHMMKSSQNNRTGLMDVHLVANGETVVQIRRADEWAASMNQQCIALDKTSTDDKFVTVAANSSLNGTTRIDEIYFDGTNVNVSLNGTTGSRVIPKIKTIDEIQIWFCSSNSSSYPVAEMLISDLQIFNHDDITTLAEKAGITASSIDELLIASSTLLGSKKAVQFMIAQCTGDFMASAIASSTFLTALETSPYKTLIQSNEHWAKFLAMVA